MEVSDREVYRHVEVASGRVPGRALGYRLLQDPRGHRADHHIVVLAAHAAKLTLR